MNEILNKTNENLKQELLNYNKYTAFPNFNFKKR